MKKKKVKRIESLVELSKKRRNETSNNLAITSFILVLFAIALPIILWLSNKQDFFDRTLSLSPYKVFYFSSVAFLILISWLVSRKNPKFKNPQRKILFSFIPIIGFYILISSDYSVFLYSQPDRVKTYSSLLTFSISVLISAFILIKGKDGGQIVNFVAIGVLVYLSGFLVINEFHPYNANSLNLSIVIHPIIQATLGVGLQSDIRAQYGMYGEILAPLISASNWIFSRDISITQISSILAVIFFLSYIAVYLFLRRHVNNRKLLGISFIGFLYLSLFAVTTWPSELYYQYYPIRLLFPMTSLLIIYVIGKSKSDKHLIFSFIYLTLGVFWNLDVGLFTILAALVYYYVIQANQFRQRKPNRSDIWRTALPVVTVTITILAINVAHLLRYGKVISFELFLGSQKLFLSGQIPPINGVWRAIFLVYIATLTYSIICIYQGYNYDFQAQMLFMSLLGLGLFLYFINNPHPAVLSNTWWPAFVILIIYTDRMLKSCEFWSLTSQLKILLSVTLVLPLSWIGSVGLVNLHNSQILKDQVNFNDLFISPGVSKRALWTEPCTEVLPGNKVSCVKYISAEEKYLTPSLDPGWVKKSKAVQDFFGQKDMSKSSIAVFSMWDYLIYMDLGSKSPFRAPNFYHTYLTSEWLDIEQKLKKTSEKGGVEIVIVDDQFGLWSGDTLAHPSDKINSLKNLLDTNFILTKSYDVGFTWYIDKWMPNSLNLYTRK